MKALTIRTLYVAFAAAWLHYPDQAVAETQSQYGGFPLDSLQVFDDYIRGQEMMPVAPGPPLRQAVEAIPIDPGAPIDPEQEAGLREWLYDFLVAFSASGDDSLAAAFYLRERVKNPDPEIKSGIPELFENTKVAHQEILANLGRDYVFANVSFLDSEFRLFAMQGQYDSYKSYAKAHGMIPKGTSTMVLPLRQEIETRLAGGEQMIFADIMFIAEEPEEFSTFETPGRTPSFFRLVWEPEWGVWRQVEAFFSAGVPQLFLFGM